MSDLDLLKTRLVAAGTTRVYKAGEVPPGPTYPYSVVGLDTGTPSSGRTDGRFPNTRYRLTVQMFSRTDDGLRDLATEADEAFKEVCLTELDGDPYCWRELAAPVPPQRDPDGGSVLYALHVYRF